MTGQPELCWHRVKPKALPIERTTVEILEDALSGSPMLAAFLDSAAAAGEAVLLMINDAYRSTQTRPVLTVLARLARQRHPPLRFRALVATGTHQVPPPERREFEAATFSGCGLAIEQVLWHDAEDDGLLTRVAHVRIHHRVAKSRFLLPIGSIEPHYFAGVTGTHKTATIGCLARADIERNHAGALSTSADVLRLNGNPVFDGIAEILRALQAEGRNILAVAEVVREHKVLAAAVGHPLETIDALLPVVRQVYAPQLDRPVDVLRLKVPPPLGRSFYQADKALKNNHRAVRDGGGIVLEAPCPEGVGQDAFLSLLRRARDYVAAVKAVTEQGYRLGDHKAVMLRYLTDPAARGVHVALVGSRVSQSDAEVLAMKLFESAEPAIAWLASVVNLPFERGLVIEDAGLVTVTVT